eukprot:TRINITY_DN315_c0_g2_i2.p2 TRINITY_DN315_c0_g2~~TRINITY_DN315_c0_g2_i2.p2  ORF type:complete len:113 (-),score=14.67 TRINITY_DN315_c0_g2_i2:247-585(-)
MSCEMRFLLPTGQDTTHTFPDSTTVLAVKKHLVAHWPAEFPKTVTSPNDLKIILAGHFLENKKSLSSCKVPSGQKTTVHLIIQVQQQPKEEAPPKSEPPKKPKQGGCKCIVM